MNSKFRTNLWALGISSALLAAGYLIGQPVHPATPFVEQASFLDDAALDDTALAEPAVGEADKAIEVGGPIAPLRVMPGPLPVMTMPYFSFAPLLPRRTGS